MELNDWHGFSSSVDGGDEDDDEEFEEEVPAPAEKNKKEKQMTEKPKPVEPKRRQQQTKRSSMLNKYFGAIIPRMTYTEAVVKAIPFVIIIALGACLLFLPKKWVSPVKPTEPPTTPRPRVTLPSWLTDTFG